MSANGVACLYGKAAYRTAHKLILASAAIGLVIALLPAGAFASGGERIDVRITDGGPWLAHLVNFDLNTVQSVTYYIQDASSHWRKTQPAISPPFEAPVNWWEGDNSGYEVVTAHVTLLTGQELKDPGGWHWVDGHHTDPKGSIHAWTNADGTPGAIYTPASHLDDIKAVEFWFRDANDHWHDVGPGSRSQEDVDWLMQSFKGIPNDWQGPEDAVSVHVVWPGDQQLVDPARWAQDFTPQSSAVVATPTELPTATCGDPHAHVYSPDRLQLLASCVTLTGVVDAIRKEKDGDLHVLLHLDPGEEKYINAKNAEELGDLVLEPVCVAQPTQADAVSACAGYRNPVSIPEVGTHISVTGPWVLDLDHGWLEIHPVSSFGSATTPTSAPQPAPSPVSAAPAPPPADPYAALRAQGVSAICNDGTYSYSKTRRGTCSHHGGVRVWTGLI